MPTLLLAILTLVQLLVIYAIAYNIHLRIRTNGLPRIGRFIGVFGQNLQAAKADFQANGRQIMMDAYREMKNSNYVVQTQNMEAFVISPKHLPELRMLPLTEISHAHAMVEKILGQFCGIDIMTKSRLHADVCRINLTRNLPEFFPGMHDVFAATSTGFLKQFPPNVPVPAFGFVFTLVMAITSRVMVGEAICQDPAWQGLVSAYLGEVIHTAKSLRPYPKLLRPFVRHLIAPPQRIEKILKDADGLLTGPILARQQKSNQDLDVMKFLVQCSPAVHPRTVILQMLVLMSASLYVSCMAASEALYDIVGKPEYVGALRGEITAAVEAEGGWNYNTVKRLQMVDSFLKESFRFKQPEALGFLRVALVDVKLSDGTMIPKGSFLGLPAGAMSRDPEYYDQPEKFEGLRFFRKSAEPLNSNQGQEHEFAGIEPGNVGWGSGRSTCPGRWFASAMNKLIIAGLIDKYDIVFPGDQKESPASTEDNGGLIPSQTQGLLFIERKA